MADVVTFFLARLDEDEAAAKAATVSQPWVIDASDPEALRLYQDGSGVIEAHVEEVAHIARHDPARVLADVAAKRAIIARVAEAAATIDGDLGCCHDAESLARGWRVEHFAEDGTYIDDGFQEPLPADCVGLKVLRRAVAPLATVFDTHPDYHESWRP